MNLDDLGRAVRTPPAICRFSSLIVFALLAVLAVPRSGDAQSLDTAPDDTTSSPVIESVTIHPPVAAKLKCSEHPLGQEDHPGDALAKDCNVVRYNAGPDGRFPSFYRGDGTRNADWYSWNEPLLAPFDAVVKLIHVNPITNQPGTLGEGPSSFIGFERIGDRGTKPIQVGYVHVRDIQVQVGDTVQAGEFVARIGNNGIAWFPHVHIGAVRGDITKMMRGELSPEQIEPLQIRFDLAAMGRLQGYVD